MTLWEMLCWETQCSGIHVPPGLQQHMLSVEWFPPKTVTSFIRITERNNETLTICCRRLGVIRVRGSVGQKWFGDLEGQQHLRQMVIMVHQCKVSYYIIAYLKAQCEFLY